MSLALKDVLISLGGRQLIKSVNLSLNPGEVVGLLGPNGAGKTTTFSLVIGLLRHRRSPLVAGLALLWFFSTGLVAQLLWRWVESPWQRGTPEAAPLADAIVVLSGGRHAAPGPERITEWHDPDRFLAGVELFQAGRAPRLLFTGGRNPFHPGLPPEGELYRQEAMALGIAERAMASTPPVRNTAEEARAIRSLLPAPQHRVLLVTSAFHMRRLRHCLNGKG